MCLVLHLTTPPMCFKTFCFCFCFLFLKGGERVDAIFSMGLEGLPLRTKETQERAVCSPWWLWCRTQPGRGSECSREEWRHHSRCTGFTMPSWHGEQLKLPQLLSIKQSWHFGTRQRRWLAALEVSVWPLSQHCLPSPGPLTSVGQGPQQTHCRPAWAPQWSHSGALQQAPLEGTSSSCSTMPLAKALFCVGVGSGCGDSSWQPVHTVLKGGLLTEGTDIPMSSGIPGTLPIPCPRPTQGSCAWDTRFLLQSPSGL